jgi:acetoin utilization protein AcuB
MFIENTMTRKVITITKELPIGEAQALMTHHKIRHLPVVADDNLLIGMVTDRDIRSALPYHLMVDSSRDHDDPTIDKERDKLANLTVGKIMSTDLIKISPMDTIQDALLLIQRSKVGALPVVDEQDRLKGIVSVRDLLRSFINVLGIGEPGTLICVLVEEKVGQLKRIVDAVTEMNVSFGSVLVARYWDEEKRAVFIYLLTLNIAPVKRKLKELGFSLIDPMQWYIDQLPKNE